MSTNGIIDTSFGTNGITEIINSVNVNIGKTFVYNSTIYHIYTKQYNDTFRSEIILYNHTNGTTVTTTVYNYHIFINDALILNNLLYFCGKKLQNSLNSIWFIASFNFSTSTLSFLEQNDTILSNITSGSASSEKVNKLIYYDSKISTCYDDLLDILYNTSSSFYKIYKDGNKIKITTQDNTNTFIEETNKVINYECSFSINGTHYIVYIKSHINQSSINYTKELFIQSLNNNNIYPITISNINLEKIKFIYNGFSVFGIAAYTSNTDNYQNRRYITLKLNKNTLQLDPYFNYNILNYELGYTEDNYIDFVSFNEYIYHSLIDYDIENNTNKIIQSRIINNIPLNLNDITSSSLTSGQNLLIIDPDISTEVETTVYKSQTITNIQINQNVNILNSDPNKTYLFFEATPSLYTVNGNTPLYSMTFKVYNSNGLITSGSPIATLSIFINCNYSKIKFYKYGTSDIVATGSRTSINQPFTVTVTGSMLGVGFGEDEFGRIASIGSDPHISTFSGRKYDLHPSTRKWYSLYKNDKINIQGKFSSIIGGIYFNKVKIIKNNDIINIDYNNKKIKCKNSDIIYDSKSIMNYNNMTSDHSSGKLIKKQSSMKLLKIDDSRYPLDLYVDFETKYLHFVFPKSIPPKNEIQGILI